MAKTKPKRDWLTLILELIPTIIAFCTNSKKNKTKQ